EPFSDLDADRAEVMARLLVDGGQCFITAVSKEGVPAPVRTLPVICIGGG
ncbi:MAG: DNA replication and repair protein RecF, partial [Candidatus Latescibacterota bacterium]